jgi:hypothetical protein
MEFCGIKDREELFEFEGVTYSTLLWTDTDNCFYGQNAVYGSLCLGNLRSCFSEDECEQIVLYGISPLHPMYGNIGFFEFSQKSLIANSSSTPLLAITRVALDSNFRGKGYFAKGLNLLEERAQYNGHAIAVCDVYNSKLSKMLLEHGYSQRGSFDYIKTWDDF